ncbi:hypothetical protein C4577_01790 [Candidatus Parcubacteria bacterium]|nr:MAG: hypothetical protein C4577_01790 [Candidatus Parcubacteria bacterium]
MDSLAQSQETICEFCEQKFVVKISKRFCSRSCMAKFANSKSPSGKKSPQIEKSCEYCGVTFYVSKAKRNSRFCSLKCFGKTQIGKVKSRVGRLKPSFENYCLFCNSKINKNRKYCSFTCKSDSITGYWSLKEDNIVLEEFENCDNIDDLCLNLNKTKDEINKRAKFFDLQRTEESLYKATCLAGKKNKGRKRPDFALNAFRFWELGLPSPFKGKHLSDNAKSKLSKKAKERWKDPKYAFKRMEGLRRNKKNGWECPNKYEISLIEILNQQYPDQYKFVGDWSLIVDGKNPDFISVDKNNVIEVFGEVYHDPKASAWDIPEHRTEEGTRRFYEEHGYRVLIVWCKEFRNQNKLIEKIRSFHESGSDKHHNI